MTTIKVKGMSCSHCTGAVQEALEKLDGAQNVVVDLDKGEVMKGRNALMQDSGDVPVARI